MVMQEWPRRHRITVEQYYRMGEAGLFAPDERVELIAGEVIDVPPMGSRHAGTATRLADALAAAVAGRAQVRQDKPIRLSDETEPQPDIAVVKARGDFYASSHPTPADVLLLVELSDATLRYDRDVKVPLYARCGIPEVWVVDLQGGQIHFHRAPAAGQYTSVSSAAAPGVTAIAALPGVRVDLAALHLD